MSLLPYKGAAIIYVASEEYKELFHKVQKELSDFEYDYLPDNLVCVWKGYAREAYVGKYVLEQKVWDEFVKQGGVGYIVDLSTDYQLTTLDHPDVELINRFFNNSKKDTSMALSNIPITRREEQLILAFRAIERFNAIIGNPQSYGSLLNQLERVNEELKETYDAMVTTWEDADGTFYEWRTELDKLGLLDGIDDVLVTSLGLIAKAEVLGYDVLGGLSAVAANNDTKYHDTEDEADKTVEMYKNKGEDVYKQYNEVYDVWVVKRKSDNKLLKPYNFVSVTLNEFLPNEEK